MQCPLRVAHPTRHWPTTRPIVAQPPFLSLLAVLAVENGAGTPRQQATDRERAGAKIGAL
ncbi:hypothetical protein PTRG_07570 [Pyrenophora tritici-repentis Pt-1C-BFP]|uniref:Uncharacterized protein n=1 Tax=Pyrenophora tritici-repentis (strain Pt-1C-BFP) TaxID=426418 RepID=B2WC61_PYRTR|nr:uncharacterized protein PTRG_07570 [Pyrenophora tritici-repentis Pt-1C-BFP]EDU50489.1 hypothetical protein PTRG_07570 [Pyrenophora tritici-repentis Pt-1C-BFP]